jgi:serine/threonine-protein kinase
MASVLLCEDERLGRQVAVKRLHSDSPVDVEHRFNREAKLGASLNHPNLVSVFDTTTDDEGVLIVMEYVEGEPLSRMLRRGPLRPEEVVRMVRDLGDALDHAHAQGVVHRDVKPGNVLIRHDGLTKLADLGIATASDGTRITRSGTVLGTAAYMAPEQLDGGDAGPPADIYALAAIAFEALSGRRPREGRSPMEIAHKIATEGAPDLRDAWPKAPKEAAQVLQRGMAKNARDRPDTAGELARELAAALETAPEPTKKTRFLRREPRRSAAAAAAGGAAAGAAVGAGAAAARPAASAPAASRPAEAPPSAPDTNGSSTPPRGAAAADREPPTGPPRDGKPHRSTGRRPSLTAIVLALVFIVLAGAALAGSLMSGGDDDGSSESSADRTPAEAAQPKKKEQQPEAKKEQQQEEAAPAAPAAPAPAEEAPAPAEEQPASDDPARGAALNDEGFTLMNQGNYEGAIPVLQQAVDSFPPGTDDINYAYALYNLGKSLRKVGRFDEAIPLLEQRLQYSDQRATVQRELDLARQRSTAG